MPSTPSPPPPTTPNAMRRRAHRCGPRPCGRRRRHRAAGPPAPREATPGRPPATARSGQAPPRTRAHQSAVTHATMPAGPDARRMRLRRRRKQAPAPVQRDGRRQTRARERHLKSEPTPDADLGLEQVTCPLLGELPGSNRALQHARFSVCGACDEHQAIGGLHQDRVGKFELPHFASATMISNTNNRDVACTSGAQGCGRAGPRCCPVR